MQKNILKKIATVLVAFLISFPTFSVSAKEKEITKEYQGTISKEKLKETLKENEYALYDEETDTTTIINKDDELPKMITRSAKSQVLSGKELSKGTSFHWGADSSYYWEDIHISEYSVNGEIGYCLEPSVIDVATNNANGTGLNNIKSLRIMDDGSYNFIPTSDQIKKIKLIANYGYQYPGHQTIKYRWATQMLIWETIGWVFDDYGSLGKCGAERNEIMNLVSTHEEKPNWNNQTKNVKIGDTLDLNDPKLNKFNVHKTTIGIQILKKEANNLKIKILSKDAKLILEKPRGVDIGTSFIYSDGSTQSVANFKLQDPAKAILNFNVISEGTLKIAKVDTKGTKVPNVKFKAWYSDDPSKSWECVTGNDGTVTIPEWEADNEISIQEIEVPNHLVLDSAIKTLFLKENQVNTVTFVNDVKSSLRIYKKDKDTGDAIPNTKFNLLDENKNLIKQLITDDRGISEELHLNAGKYFIQEIEVPAPYIINPKNSIQEIQIENNNGFYEIKFENQKQEIEILKTDKDTGKVIPNTEFNILNEDKEVLYTTYTNEKGIAKVPFLKAGKYYIEEVSVPAPYVIDENESVKELVINDEQAIYQVHFENEVRKIDFVLYKQDDKSSIKLNGAIFEFSIIDKNGERKSLGNFITGGLILKGNPNEKVKLYTDEGLTQIEGEYTFDKNGEVILDELGEGVYFVNSDGKTIKHYVAKGMIYLPRIPEGYKVVYKELKAPIGYQIDTDKETIVDVTAKYGVNKIENYRNNSAIQLLEAGDEAPTIYIIAGAGVMLFAIVVITKAIKEKQNRKS